MQKLDVVRHRGFTTVLPNEDLPLLCSAVTKALSFRDPKYFLHKQRNPNSNWDGMKRYCEETAEGVTFRTGLEARVNKALKPDGICIDLDSNLDPIPYNNYFGSGFALDPEQEKVVVEMLRRRQAVAEMSVGSGKTFILAAIAANYWVERHMPVVVIVPKQQLMHQIADDFAKMLPRLKIGRFGDGKRIEGQIVVGIPATLVSDDPKVKELLSKTGAMAFDECHHIVANSWQTLPDMCPLLERQWAVSGKVTFFSNEIAQVEIEEILGEPVVQGRNEARLCPVEVVFHDTVTKTWKKSDKTGDKKDGDVVYEVNPRGISRHTYYIGGIFGTGVYDEYGEIVKRTADSHFLYNIANDAGIVLHKERNQWAIALIKEILNNGGSACVATRRKIHVLMLENSLKQLGIEYVKVVGGMTGVNQAKAFEQFQNGEVDVIVSNYNCLMEGTNIPRLTDLIRLDGQSGEQICEQIKGRVERKCEGKTVGRVHIPGDFYNKSLRKAVLKMKKYYSHVKCKSITR